ncbi:hypothetical protein COP2_040119 [Malus domestica]
MGDEFNSDFDDDFDDDFAVHSLCSCGPGALCCVQFRLMQVRSIGVAFYARADQERCAMQFRLVRARSLVSCSLGSCRQ